MGRAQIHAGLSKSMWHPGAECGPGAGRFVRWLGSLPLCVVSRVRANKKDTPARNLGQRALCVVLLLERVWIREGKNRFESQQDWQNLPNRDHPVPPLPGAREGRGSLELVEIFQMRPIPRRFTPVCRSRCGAGGAERGPGAGVVRAMGPRRLCVVLLVQANRDDTSDRAMGPAAESTL